MNKKIKIGIVIITGAIMILLVILSFNFNSQAKKVVSVVQPNIVMDKAIWEEPAQVAMKMVSTDLLDDDYAYQMEHIYCDVDCERILQQELGMSFSESMEFDKKISVYDEKVKIYSIAAKEVKKTNSNATYDVYIDYSPIDNLGDGLASIRSGQRIDLIKKGTRWMLDTRESLYGTISIYKNYIKILDDIKKCQEIGPIVYEMPKEGGIFSISDKNNPLYGFSIRMPALKENITIKVSCFSSFLPLGRDFFYVSLPISIEMDKVFEPEIIASKENVFPGMIWDVKKTEEDKKFSGKWPLITIPYYDIALDNSKIKRMVTSIITSDNKIEDPRIDKNIIPMQYDIDKKVVEGYFGGTFSYLQRSCAIAESIQNVKL